jgi:hypothetical protein
VIADDSAAKVRFSVVMSKKRRKNNSSSHFLSKTIIAICGNN